MVGVIVICSILQIHGILKLDRRFLTLTRNVFDLFLRLLGNLLPRKQLLVVEHVLLDLLRRAKQISPTRHLAHLPYDYLQFTDLSLI